MTYGIKAAWPGTPYPLGATWDGQGVNFALFSEHAERVELCLFDIKGRSEVARIDMREQTDLVWHCYLPDARPGQLYGYRVYGPYNPQAGHRFNPNKLLLDPYAKAFAGAIKWGDTNFGYRVGHAQEDLSFDRRNNAAHMPKCQVIDPAFSWGEDRPLNTPWHETVIYEAHVRGFTMQHPEVPLEYRGKYSALATAPVIEHLKRLGVTAVELMPVHTLVHDRYLIQRGLKNYWGYNSIGYFAPEASYAADHPDREFKTMVKTLHSAGIEVILDVVYNHTAEGSHLGPTLCFRGIDNSAYYRLLTEDRRYYMDYTGCGNTLNMQHPRVLQLIMDSLRYWITEMHVDGFRFDLAAALARELHAVDRLGAFFDIIHQDPIISRVKLIAEPWDLGEGGYQVGQFPPGWTEWNGKYRDVMRAFWKGDGGLIGDFASRLSGSSDLYGHSGRRPYASINFIVSHDGFTLQDLVSYDHKHNAANREDNRDGDNHNLSWNCGVEGPSDDATINALRARQIRNFMTTLILSQGVPMLTSGDEMGRTQRGNNNAYCQDNELSWIDWQLNAAQRDLLTLVSELLRLRAANRVFRRRNFFQGRASAEGSIHDVLWLDPSGAEMTTLQWHQGFARCLGVYLSGSALGERDERGQPVTGNDFLMLFNAHHESRTFSLPATPANARWTLRIDTHISSGIPALEKTLMPAAVLSLEGRSMMVFESPPSLAAPVGLTIGDVSQRAAKRKRKKGP